MKDTLLLILMLANGYFVWVYIRAKDARWAAFAGAIVGWCASPIVTDLLNGGWR